jgi:inosine-uridine nucleoside N-ribohydrolase
MWKIFKFFLFIVSIILVASCLSSNQDLKQAGGTEKVKIIFDTDMGPDYDDVGAIAVLHALADSGECEILATVSSNSYKNTAVTIETFNRYFNKPDIPIGIPEKDIININPKNHWNDSVNSRFFPKFANNTGYPSATEVYRKTLSSQPDKSVTIVTVGFVSNLEYLLKSKADNYSPLPGIELIRQKVNKWIAMAGKFPEGREYNVFTNPEASVYTFRHWPTPILFSGFEIGHSILTGNKLSKKGSPDNPVAWAYKYNLKTHANHPVKNRMSWDQTAVLCAIRSPEKYFYICGPGEFTLDNNGYNHWNPDEDAGHYFLVHKYPYERIAGVLENLMMHEPK